MLNTVWLPMAKVRLLYPMLSTVMDAPAGTLSEKAPFMSVAAPIRVLPTTITAAPMTGWFWVSVTVPLMVRFWARETPMLRKQNNKARQALDVCKSSFFLIV